MLLLSGCHVWAKEKKAQGLDQTSFKNPLLLLSTSINHSDDAKKLLESNLFRKQLSQLAKTIDKEIVNQQNMFNKMALLSASDQNTQLLTILSNYRHSVSFTHYRLHSQTILQMNNSHKGSFTDILSNDFATTIKQMDNKSLFHIHDAIGWSVERAQDFVLHIFKRYQKLPTLNQEQAINLVVNSHLHNVLAKVIPTTRKLMKAENLKRYDITPEVLIETPEGIELAATIVKQKKISKTKLPAALQFTIYADQANHITTGLNAAAHGYVGIVANTRGKRSSSNEIIPWEHEGKDATQIIDWISKQPWSDGRVVMYGGSYNGYTQWAATKYMHPALKAIAPYTAANLITGLPYENNILLTGNYEWAFHVTNNRTMDRSVYADRQKSNKLISDFFISGRPAIDIDKIDGKPNPWFQKWLKHPDFDSYYQAMVPVKEEYAHINIPVLTITGYFDGGQISAIDYLSRHNKYNNDSDHTLLIGPYDHFTAQQKPMSHYSNYQLDEVALDKDTEEVVFAWFDHVLYQKPKPDLLKGKVNYQLMGANVWRHEDSITSLNNDSVVFSLNTTKDQNGHYQLTPQQLQPLNSITQTVDLADRQTQHNQEPWPVIQEQLNEPNGLIFITDEFKSQHELAGMITGHFSISINKKDVDIGYNLYEINENGQAFHLNNYRSRASYSHDMSKRQLLTPGEKTKIPIINARMTAKLIKPGSRLAIVLNVNKNRDAQVNMGTGKTVNLESTKDAGEPLHIKWFNDSVIRIPLKRWQK